MKNICIDQSCDKEIVSGWFCKYHHLEKEANYGLYDLTKNTYRNKKEEEFFKAMGVKRLIQFVEYIFKNPC